MRFNRQLFKVSLIISGFTKRPILAVVNKIKGVRSHSDSLSGRKINLFDHHCHTPARIKCLQRPHNLLCDKSELYHNWHHHPHHQKVHIGTLAVYVVLIISILISQLAIPTDRAFAATNTWSFGSSADYDFNTTSLEVTSNQARLKLQQYADDANTQALWHFDESEGSSAADSAGNSNTATLQNSASFAAGRAGNGLSLSGADQHATAADSASLSLSSSMTLEAYLKFNSAFDNTDNVDLSLIDKGNYKIYFDSSDGKLKFELEGNGAKSWSKVGEDLSGGFSSALPTGVRSIAEYNSELYIGTTGAANSSSAEVWKYSGSGTAWTKVGGDDVNRSWAADFEEVESLVVYNSKLYAGLGTGAGDGEVWEYSDTNWIKVGGDGLNSGWLTNYDYVHSMAADGTYLYAGLGATAGEAEVWRWNGTTWSQIGGDGVNSSWTTVFEMVYSLNILGSNLYAGLGNSAGAVDDADVWEYNGTSWTQIGGTDTLNNSVQSSWTDAGNYEIVYSLVNDGTYLYAGLGSTAGDAEVWRYDPAADTWGGALIGGDSTGWGTTYDYVRGLTVIDGTLYAGLGDSANESEVWSTSTSSISWSQIGGDAISSSWTYNKEYAWVGSFGSDLIVGTGGNAEDAEVWRRTGTTWNWIGGRDWTSWGAVQPAEVEAMTVHDNKLYVAFGYTNKFAVIWQYDGSTWTHVGGSNINSSWAEDIEYVRSLVSYNGKLYAGLGDTAGDADVYEFNGTNAWTKIGGDTERSSWAAATYERVRTLAVFQGNLYAGLGSGSREGELWRYDGSAWSQVGGDGANSSWGSNNEIFSLIADGQYLYAGLGADSIDVHDSEVWRYDGSSWTVIGGDHINQSWYRGQMDAVYSSATFNGKTYYGIGNAAAGGAEVWELNGSTWIMVGGNNINSSWVPNTFEGVYSLAADASYLYAGLATSAGDGEVWRYNSTSWEKIGGDGLNSGWADATYEYVYSMASNGTTLYAGLGITADDAEVWSWNGSAWTKIGGDGANSGWADADNIEMVYSLAASGSNLYAGTGNTAGDADVWLWNGSAWTKIGGDGVNSGWAAGTFEMVQSLAVSGSTIYAGLGSTAGEAEVWSWNGSAWTQIGGDSLNSGWTTGYETVMSLAVSGSTLYASLGQSAGDGEVWSWNGSAWTKIGGDTVNSSWADGTYEEARTLVVSDSTLFAGLGITGNSLSEAEVWSWNGSAWTKVGGDSVNSSWPSDIYFTISSFSLNQGTLYAGLGNTTGEAEVWSWNGSTWTQIGGDGLNSGWANNEYENVLSLASYNGELYAGLGTTVGDAEVWKWSGSAWTKIGGDATGTGWLGGVYESALAMTVYEGKLYVGLGSSTGLNISDGEIWAYGSNSVLASATASWSADTWYHVAATYDGATMKLYINGTENSSASAALTLADNALPLYIGKSLSNDYAGQSIGTFAGLIDEMRISNTARSSFTTAPYAGLAITVQPDTPLDDVDVAAWSGFEASATLNGGTITYRLSDDGGTGWKYYTAGAWTTSSSTSQANSASDVNTNIATFPVTNSGILWQAILLGNGDQQVILSSVQITYTEDTTNPTNPTSTAGLNASGGSTALVSGNWHAYAAPYFSWSGAADAGSGIEGYWVYFGTSNSADPRTARGLANEQNGTGVRFQSGTALTIGTDTEAISTGNIYYLRVLAKDKAENYPDSAYVAFTYKYDATAPTAPAFVSVSPSGYSSSRNFTFLWPGSGTGAATDSGAPTTGSDIAGYQYKTGVTTGALSSWSATIVDNQVALTDATYQDGANTFYLRVVDNAGNVSSEVTATYYYAGNAPTAPTSLSATPSTSETNPAASNAFAFSWGLPATYNGSIKQYHYSINVLPTANNSIATTQTALLAGPFATQQGKNSLYVVAEDEAGNINYNLYASVDFYAETPAPGIPLDPVITDSSNRVSSDYRLTITWSAPTSGGTVGQYIVKRSLDGVTFDQVGTVASTGYIDSGLTVDTTYFYKIYAKDDAGSVSADPGVGGTVSKKPTGKYTTPPTIDASSITSAAGATSATITWTTDRRSDSFIEYGLTAEYGSSFGAREEVTSHSVKITGLAPGTTYHFRAQSLDPGDLRDYSQSLGYSEDYTIVTTPAPALASVVFSDITTNSAILSFETNKASSSTVEYGTSTNYGQTLTDDSGSSTTKHVVRLKELQDGTTYQVKVTIKDTDNNEVASPGHAFTTIAKPRIESVRFESMPNEPQTAVKVTWNTNVPTSGYVEYGSEKEAKKEASHSKFETSHEFIIRGLLDESVYAFQAISRDQFGNEVKSDSNTFTTPLDSRPPKVKNLTIEVKSSGFGENQKAQIVATWETDEPATSQLEYGPGISGKDYPNKTKEDVVLSNSHVVIAGELDPSKIYHLRAVARDRSGNVGMSEDTTIITGKIQKNVLDIILNSLERSLGWAFEIFK